MNPFSKKNLIHISVIAVVLIILIFVYVKTFSAPQSNAQTGNFIIGLNSKTSDIPTQLQSQGFVRSSWMASLVLGGRRILNNIQPGGYEISKSMNVWQIASVLLNPPYLKWIVIPEGLRKEEIADILAKKLDWSDEGKTKWIKIYTAQDEDHFEGVYFPETYLIPSDESPSNVADRLRAKFEEKFTPAAKEANKQNVRWTTLLKIASIVQREAAGKTDMPLVAGIIWNRLLDNMKLDVDSTLQYARGNTGKGWWAPITLADKQIDSAYNTYKYSGLPPHPIDNPGLNAIDAVLFPAKTDCFYYLHDNSGNIHCAKTYEEHLKNIDTYLK